MAYRIKIKHNIEGEQIPLHLKYESNDNFPEIPITMTDTEQTVTLTGWNPGEDGLDVDKIKIREKQYEINDKIYEIESVGINISAGPETAGNDVIQEIVQEDVSIDENTPESHQAAIIAEYNAHYSTGSYNTSIGELICTDETKHLYDRTYDIRHTRSNESLSDEEFHDDYGDIAVGAFIAHKSADGYKGRVSYGSIYYNTVLIEANSQYARFKDYLKNIIGAQSINEEGRKAGATSYGLLRRENRCCTVSVRIPDVSDTVVRLYDGPDENADILSITFAPDYTEASTAYRPCTGDIYVNDTKVCSGDAFVRVRLQKGVQYIIHADNISFMKSTDWQTLGNHYVTMPLYSDNILKIVVFNENNDHGIYPNLYQQARANNWGLPASLFTPAN